MCSTSDDILTFHLLYEAVCQPDLVCEPPAASETESCVLGSRLPLKTASVWRILELSLRIFTPDCGGNLSDTLDSLVLVFRVKEESRCLRRTHWDEAPTMSSLTFEHSTSLYTKAEFICKNSNIVTSFKCKIYSHGKQLF